MAMTTVEAGNNRNYAKRINYIIVLIFLLLTTIFVLYPIIYVVSGAFSPGTALTDMSILPFSKGMTTEHFTYLFEKTDYIKWYGNTLIVAASVSILTLLVCSLSAYVFSRFRFRLKKGMMLSMLVLQIFPSFVGMRAIYVILMRVDGFDQLWGLVLVYLAGNIPYNTWLLKSYLDTIPISLDEAARIDGANHFKIFATVVMPIARPILAFLVLASFVGPWMDFIFPKIILRSPEKMTLGLGLYQSFVTDRKNEFTNFAAGALLVAIPFIFFFTLTQKQMVTSLGGAAVKE